MIEPSAWLLALLGGVLIGVAATLFLAVTGRVAGISGLLRATVFETGLRLHPALLFVAGLLIAGVLGRWLLPSFFGVAPAPPLSLRMLGGLFLVGVGATLANGCTSGHGICGLSRLSKRSLVAIGVFMLAGALVVSAMSALA